jgi:hypothetical protein
MPGMVDVFVNLISQEQKQGTTVERDSPSDE